MSTERIGWALMRIPGWWPLWLVYASARWGPYRLGAYLFNREGRSLS